MSWVPRGTVVNPIEAAIDLGHTILCEVVDSPRKFVGSALTRVGNQHRNWPDNHSRAVIPFKEYGSLRTATVASLNESAVHQVRYRQ